MTSSYPQKDKHEIAVCVAYGFGKMILSRKYSEKEWNIVPIEHQFDFENFEYKATDKQIYRIGT